MRSGLAGRARRYLDDAARAVERAPVEVAVAVFTAAAFSYAVETGGEAMRSWVEVAVCAALIFAGAWTATLLHALGAWTRATRWAVTLAVAFAVLPYGLFVIDFERGAEGWRAVMLIGAAVLWLLALPYFAGGADPGARIDRMRDVTGRVLLRVIGALLYCAALFAGLALALAAVNALFELNLEGEIYGHVFGWIFLALAPWIVVGGLSDYAAPAEPRQEVAGVVHRMAAWLVPPLLALYTLILYAYAVRIAVTGEIPKNIVSPMVLAAGLLAVAALLLFDPRARGTAGERTLRAAPPLLLPLTVLGVAAITMRVGQYGWTEFRLLRLAALALLALLAAGAAVQVLRRQRLALHIAPLALAALLLLGAVGPWSVMSIARSSQQQRLERALAAAGVRPAAGDTMVVSAAVFDDINSTAWYLVSHHGLAALPEGVAAAFAEPGDARNAAYALGLRRELEPAQFRHLSARLDGAASVALGGVTAHRVFAGPRRDAGALGNAVLDGEVLRIRVDAQVYVADVAGLFARTGLDRVHQLSAAEAAIPVTDEAGAARGVLLLIELSIERPQDGAAVLRGVEGVLLLEAGIAR